MTLRIKSFKCLICLALCFLPPALHREPVSFPLCSPDLGKCGMWQMLKSNWFVGETERPLGLVSGDRNWSLNVLTTCWLALGHLCHLSEPGFLHPWNDVTWNGWILQIMSALKCHDISLLAKISESLCVGCFLDKWVMTAALGLHQRTLGKTTES